MDETPYGIRLTFITAGNELGTFTIPWADPAVNSGAVQTAMTNIIAAAVVEMNGDGLAAPEAAELIETEKIAFAVE